MKLQITIHQAKQFLSAYYSNAVTDMEFIGTGEWSQAFSYTTGNTSRVIRFGAHKEDFLKDQRAAGIAPKTLGVPKIEMVGRAFGGYFAISERAYGEMIDKLDAPHMKRLVPAVMDMFNDLRIMDIGQTEGYGQWDSSGNAPWKSWSEYLLRVAVDDPARRIFGWRQKLACSPMGDKKFEIAYRYLQGLVRDLPNERYMIHGDLLNYNVLTSNDQISAVIDWGCAMYGDFLYDIAWFAYWAPYYSSMRGINWEQEAAKYFESKGVHVTFMKERLLCYKIHIGLDAQSYNAFMGNYEELEQNTKQTLGLLGTE